MVGSTKDYFKHISAPAGESGTVTIVVAPAGKKLVLKETVVHFPAGTEGKLQVQVRYGDMPIIPDSGYITGDDCMFTSKREWEFEAGTPITIYYENTDPSYAKDCYVQITVEEVDLVA